ncbi:cytochrome o ubiquinol oxidase subunit IV [Buchnera aphidicola]|uniref:cytochrome o ubiquinol oxidase subunit IV n=1 Tax=Buchnera aphidicola TaxID=9 RepID=UPI0034648B9C
MKELASNKKKKFLEEIYVYGIGFLLSFILTVFPFFMVVSNFFSKFNTLFFISIFAIIQIIIHFKYFFKLEFSKTNPWYLISIFFSLIIIFIIIFGSIWIMFNLSYHLMDH